MDLFILHKIMFFSWLLIGIVYCIFLSKRTGKIGIMEIIAFTTLGPLGWIHLGLIGLFQKQYRKNPDLVNTFIVIVALIITIVLMYVVFPLIRMPM